PVYKGQGVYNREETITGHRLTWKRDPSRLLMCERRYRRRPEDQWVYIPAPPLVDEGVWERCQARLGDTLGDKQAILGGNPSRKYMLSGLLFCDRCGWRINGTGKHCRGKRVPYYSCYKNLDCPSRYRSRAAHLVHEMLFQQLAFVSEQPEQVAETIL